MTWKCCGQYMYMARSERDEEGTPVHYRRCAFCGNSIETEERILRSGVFHLRAYSKTRRDRRYEAYEPRTCRVCELAYRRGVYGKHILTDHHQRALARRRRSPERHARQLAAQARYRARQRAA